ncbi:GNAT family N-acetyltransferase [Nocardioides panacisoli]|uniref:GNAT family N-acetyltransferase n=1 Tax=Nocardioides panacisoli TaxID=627624 RepID=UPI001C630543|nr:GNAT family N-acetyltransferase [Nocardioides panacisoli]QYJ03872.1 GNAT family N-acetyltransferase [Nocardioides panacisoli]
MLRIERVGYDHPDAAALIEQVQGEYVARYGSRDDSPIDPLMFVAPEGTFLVGYVGAEPVASGAWRRSPVRALGGTSAAEIKRMYVAAHHRGAGHARALLAELERTAAEAGYDLLVLETGTRQPEAIELYRSAGYEAIPGFGHYKAEPLSRCFGKLL